MEQEKSSRIRLTLTLKEIYIGSESGDTDSDNRSVEIHSSEVSLFMTSASKTSEETLGVPRPDPSKDHFKDSTSHAPYDSQFIGRRREPEIAGLVGGQPTVETDSPIVLDGQSLREISTSDLVQSAHSEPTNGLNLHENTTCGPSTVLLPRSTTYPLPTKARPNVTFTTRPASFEHSTLGEISSPLRSDSDANIGERDTTIPDTSQFTRPKNHGSTGYPRVVRLDKGSRYPHRSNGEYHHNSRPLHKSVPLHNSARSFMYDEDDAVPMRTASPQYRNQSTPHRTRSKRPIPKRSVQEQAEPKDIYYIPPTIEKAADAPAIFVPSASVQSESRSTTPEHTAARKEEGENLIPEPRISTPRKGRKTSSVNGPVSPGSGKPVLLPIFLWPIGQSSVMNASKRAQKVSSGNLTEPTDNLPGSRSSKVNDEILAKILDDAHKQLKNSKKTNEREAYAIVETKSLQEIEDNMSKMLAKGHTNSSGNRTLPAMHKIDTLVANLHSPNAFRPNSREIRILELKNSILDSTKQLLHAFVPRNYRCSIIDKYWGAVGSVLQDSVIY